MNYFPPSRSCSFPLNVQRKNNAGYKNSQTKTPPRKAAFQHKPAHSTLQKKKDAHDLLIAAEQDTSRERRVYFFGLAFARAARGGARDLSRYILSPQNFGCAQRYREELPFCGKSLKKRIAFGIILCYTIFALQSNIFFTVQGYTTA